ncbi:MAG TPA: aminotransferase class I/II-fold pyridoxal phosphate-dependent enzyme [Steroidobacteraceae bacterium]|jgi:aromatic-L-amino-acid decarboxylase|nr:aminotransferase class I/II-fold pyridoxal phosphate-dependent enzyme [Steroidobacteraceae bacterium]
MADRTRNDGDDLTLSPDAMRRLADAATNGLLERQTGLRDDAPWRGASRAELEHLLREPPPEQGRDPVEVLERAVRDVLPVAGRVDHPRFFAFVPSAPTWPGVIADYLAAGFNTFQGTWLGAGGPSQLELVVIDWIRDWIGYPESAGGLFTSGGSAAILDALVAAREWAGAPDRPAVILSDQTHSAVERAARIIGVRREGIVNVPAADDYRVTVPAISAAVQDVRARGFAPIAVCANAGTTNTGAVDPLPAIADFCAAEKLWMHVDGAYGGFAVLCDRGRRLLTGLERADSISLDAHKWLFQPFEAGCVMVKDVAHLVRAFSVNPDYLQDTKLGLEHVNFADRGYQLTRSFRALKVWMSIQTFGMARFREAIARGIDFATRAGALVEASAELELLGPPSLGIVCFRYRPRGADWTPERIDKLNEAIQARVIASGTAMISSTRLRKAYSLRLCIMSHQTTWEDVRGTVARIAEFGRAMSAA